MKILGIVLLSLCPVIAGILASSKIKTAQLQTELIIRMISTVMQYISYEALIRSEIMHRLSSDEQFAELGFDGLNDKNVRQFITQNNKLCISKTDKEKLCCFFDNLGSTDIQGQVNHCNLFMRIFIDRLASLRETTSQKQKLYCSLGAFAGLFVAVILI